MAPPPRRSGRWPRRERRRRRRRRHNRPQRLPAAGRPIASRSLFALTDRELFIGGRVTSIDGDPARFQRYQDVRDGLLFSGFRYSFAQPDGAYTFDARANNVGWRDQEYFANYNRAGKLSVTGSYQQIPQFYSVDTMTPYTGSGGTLLLDDAAQRAAQNGAGLNPYVPIAPQFDLRERRDIGRVDVVATPTPKLDVTASFTTQKHGGELPWGASFGFSNDVEVPLPYDSRANDFTIGTEWTNTKNMLRVAYSGSWFDNLAAHARLGQPAAPRRRVGHAGTRPHVAVAVELRADDQLRRLHQAGAQDAGHRLLLLRPVEQQRAAAAVHDQFGAAADRAAARQRGCRSARVLDEPEPDVAPHHRLAVRRALPQLHLRQSDAGDEHHAVRRLRLERVDDAHGRSRSLCPRPDHVRRRRDVEQAEAARADGRLHAQRQRLRRADLPVERRGRVPRVGRRGGILHGPPSACNTRSAAAPDRAWTSRP